MTSPIERRRARRVPPEALPDTLFGRIRPGHQLRVLDISSCGVLVETGRRLPPGMIVDLHLELRDRRHTIRAQVVRCYVGVVFPEALVFRGALDFERPLPWVSELSDAVAETVGAFRVGR
jgi:hypothetical protein